MANYSNMTDDEIVEELVRLYGHDFELNPEAEGSELYNEYIDRIGRGFETRCDYELQARTSYLHGQRVLLPGLRRGSA